MTRPRRRVGLLLAVALATYGAVCLSVTVRVVQAQRHAVEMTPLDVGLRYQDIGFPSRRGDVALKGWYLPAAPNTAGRFTLVFAHGLNGERAGGSALPLAKHLVRGGFNVLLFDLRGHGESGGDKLSAGVWEQYDVLGAVDYLVDRGTPIGHIGLRGESLGAASVLLAAAEEPRLRAVVADSPFARATDLLTQEVSTRIGIPTAIAAMAIPGSVFLAQALYGIDVNAAAPEDAVRRIAVPVLIIHDEGDDRIPVEQARRVAAAAAPGSALWVLPVEGHVRAFEADPDAYVRRISTYFASRLSAP